MQEKILILDFGSQTTQLIGRRLRELNTYCEIVPYNKVPEDLTGIAGIILSGSPYSVYDEAAFRTDLSALRGRLPILGICYGAQSLVHQAGGKVEPAIAVSMVVRTSRYVTRMISSSRVSPLAVSYGCPTVTPHHAP